MPDFTVDPRDLHRHADFLAHSVAPTYATSATSVREGGHVGPPGFGTGLCWLDALYLQRVDFLAKDLQGAHDLCAAISQRLHQTAANYQRSEDLNISGFGGPPVHEEAYTTAIGQTGGVAAVPAAVSEVTVDMIEACLGGMAACSALCPAFIWATTAAALLFANPIGIMQAGIHLIREGRDIQTVLDANFSYACTTAATTWTGAGKDAFLQLARAVRGHLDQVGMTVEALGNALNSLAIGLSGLWLALIEMVGPFLLWLVAMKAAELLPWNIPVIESIIEATGAKLASGVLTKIAVVIAIADVVGDLFIGLGPHILGQKALRDTGKQGVPDLTEFTVDTNFQLRI